MRRSKAGKLPYMPVYIGEHLAETIGWSGEEQGLLLLLKVYAWARPLPNDSNALADMCRYDRARFAVLWKTLSSQFEDAEGGLIHARVEEHRERALKLDAQRADASRKGVAERQRRRRERITVPRGQPVGEPLGQPVGSSLARPNGKSHSAPDDQPFREGQGSSDLRGFPGGRS